MDLPPLRILKNEASKNGIEETSRLVEICESLNALLSIYFATWYLLVVNGKRQQDKHW